MATTQANFPFTINIKISNFYDLIYDHTPGSSQYDTTSPLLTQLLVLGKTRVNRKLRKTSL